MDTPETTGTSEIDTLRNRLNHATSFIVGDYVIRQHLGLWYVINRFTEATLRVNKKEDCCVWVGDLMSPPERRDICGFSTLECAWEALERAMAEGSATPESK